MHFRTNGVLAAGVCLAAVFVFSSGRVVRGQSAAPGGFLVSAVSTAARPLLTAGQIASWLPSRGAFTFPAPYGTQGVRLTNASDCGGADCVRGVGYSYWRNINNHVGSDTILIFLGLDRTKGGTGPTLFSYSKSTGATKNLGPLFPAGSAFENATGEGWYFSATRPTTLYVNDGPRLLRYDVISHATETVFDARTQFGADAWIWQMHSSNDDRVHSFTLKRTSDWAVRGCAAYDESQQRFFFFPARGEFDECQLDKSGRYVVIKENVDGAYGEDNVIEDLQTGTEQILLDQNGAGGHSDTGFGYLVAEDNFNSLPGVVRTWRLDMNTADPAHGRVVFRTTSWSFGDNHIAHANSKPNTAIGQQVVCSSDANRLNLPMANEILCYKLDGSQQVLVVAPVMTNLDAAGGGSDEYWKTPKGNLDVTGEYFLWTSNAGGDRMDAFMVRVPLAKLGATPATGSTGSTGSPSSPSAPAGGTSAAGCPTPDPFAILGGGTCVNGGWLPPGMATPGTSSGSSQQPVQGGSAPASGGAGCPTADPFAVLGGGTCVNGGWLPPGMAPAAGSGSSGSWSSGQGGGGSTTGSAPCTTPDPFVILGGGTCANGGWLPPGMAAPPSGAAQPPAVSSPGGATGSSAGCITPDPFAVLGGGRCSGGNWLPPGYPQ